MPPVPNRDKQRHGSVWVGVQKMRSAMEVAQARDRRRVCNLGSPLNKPAGGFALTLMTFVAIDSMAARSWLLQLVFGFVPPAMLLWLWNEDQPLPIGSLHRRQKRL